MDAARPALATGDAAARTLALALALVLPVAGPIPPWKSRSDGDGGRLVAVVVAEDGVGGREAVKGETGGELCAYVARPSIDVKSVPDAAEVVFQ